MTMVKTIADMELREKMEKGAENLYCSHGGG